MVGTPFFSPLLADSDVGSLLTPSGLRLPRGEMEAGFTKKKKKRGGGGGGRNAENGL